MSVLLWLLCLAPSGEESTLHYHLERTTAPAVHVTLELLGDRDGVTELGCAETWGGPHGGVDVEGVTASTGDEALAVERPAPHRIVVHHEPSAPLTVRWHIAANDHQAAGHPDHRRPIVNDRLFRGAGELFLFTPDHLPDEEPVDIALTFAGFDQPGHEFACSFGVGTGPLALHRSPLQLRQSVFLAGEITLLERDVFGMPLYVAMEDRTWRFTPDEFADVVAGIVEHERGFFDDTEHPFYLITLVPVGVERGGSRSLGGSGLTDSFTLEMSPGLTLADGSDDRRDILKLLAHEMFHTWNGVQLQRENPTLAASWFSEGFTDYYARRVLRDGGFLNDEDVCVLLNRALRDYYTSAVRAAPNTRIVDDFWGDPQVQKLPYHRGDVVAMCLDHEIRRCSDGERSLDDLMREMVTRAREEGWKVSTERLLALVEENTDAEFAQWMRGVVVEGATAELPEDLYADTLVRHDEEHGVFDLGFDLDPSVAAKAVTGLREGSAAANAGMYEGQRLVGWSVRHGDPDTDAVFTVEEDGARREVRFRPVSEVVVVPQFAPRS